MMDRPEHWWRELPEGLSIWQPSGIIKWGMTEAADSRTSEWWSMSSPALNCSLTLLYILFVWWGPRVMENRTAWECKNVMIVYNIVIVLLNLYMFLEILYQTVMLGVFFYLFFILFLY